MIIDTTPDRPRVLGEVDLFSAQVLVHERAIYIHESIQYYVDRLEWGERKAYVHRIDVDHYTYADRAVTLKPLEIFAEAPATGGRRDPRRGDGREPRHDVQEAQVRHRRERRLGADRPARARAPDDGLLADRRSGPRSLAARRARRRAPRRRSGDPDRRGGPAHGRPARPRARDPGPLAPRRGTDDLPVRVGAGRHRALGAALAAPRRADRRGRRAHRGLCVRGRLSGLHGAAARTRRRRAALALRLLGDLGAGRAPRSPPPDDGRGGDPGASLARRLERYRAATRTADVHARTGSIPRPRRAVRARRRTWPSGSPPPSTARWSARASGLVVRCEAPARPLAGRSGAARAAARAAAARTCRWSAWTPRRRGSRPRPGPSRSSSASAGGRATGSGRSSCSSRTTPTSRPCSPRSPPSIPADAWLVTYNGRGFDWPLLVTRYRMLRHARAAARGSPRPPAGRAPAVPPPPRGRPPQDRGDRPARDRAPWRRRRLGDPARGTSGSCAADRSEPLVDVVRHNDQDVRSLARLLAHLEPGLRGPGRATRRTGRRPGRAGPGLRASRPARRRPSTATTTRWAATDRPARRRPTAKPLAQRRLRDRPSGSAAQPWWSPQVPAGLRRPTGRTWRRDRPDRAAGLRRPRGPPSGSPSSAPTSCGGSAAGTTPSRPGAPWPRARAGRRSSPRSSSPSSTSTGGAIRRPRSRSSLDGLTLADRRRAPRTTGAAARGRPAAPGRTAPASALSARRAASRAGRRRAAGRQDRAVPDPGPRRPARRPPARSPA